MDGPERYLSDWMGYWAYMSNGTVTRWAKASQRIRRRKYSPKRAFSDALGFWNDAAWGWWGLVRGSTEGVQTVVFRLLANDQADRKRVGPFFRPGLPAGDPEILWLGWVTKTGSGKDKEIKPAENVRLRWSRDGTMLHIRLVDLATNGKTLETGIYHAIVHVEDHPLADVYIRVDPVPKTTGRTSRRRSAGVANA